MAGTAPLAASPTRRSGRAAAAGAATFAASSADVFVTSAAAVSQDGGIVSVDLTGSRTAGLLAAKVRATAGQGANPRLTALPSISWSPPASAHPHPPSPAAAVCPRRRVGQQDCSDGRRSQRARRRLGAPRRVRPRPCRLQGGWGSYGCTPLKSVVVHQANCSH